MKLWDVETKQCLNTFLDSTGVISTARFHPDTTSVAAGGDDKNILIWDSRSYRLIQYYISFYKNLFIFLICITMDMRQVLHKWISILPVII